MTAVWA